MTDATILAQVDSRRQDLIGLTQDLIRIPTLNRRGQTYRRICNCLAARLTASGHDAGMMRAGKMTAMPVVPEGARQSTRKVDAIHGGAADVARGDTGLPGP